MLAPASGLNACRCRQGLRRGRNRIHRPAADRESGGSGNCCRRAGAGGLQARLAPGARPVVGNALDAESFATAVPRGATVVHLVGTPHPGPGKGAEFVRVDLASIRATAAATVTAAAKHLVYISVAQPASVMRAYIAARTEGEALVRASGIPATILRPWYVLGPGHYWPYSACSAVRAVANDSRDAATRRPAGLGDAQRDDLGADARDSRAACRRQPHCRRPGDTRRAQKRLGFALRPAATQCRLQRAQSLRGMGRLMNIDDAH
jgi:hypothetical protein